MEKPSTIPSRTSSGIRSDLEKGILQILESFYDGSTGEAVACLETMLFEWYHHHA